MSHVPQNPPTDPPSHLKSYMREIMAGLRVEAMDLLVQELMLGFEEEKYQLDEFINALAGYVELQPGWDEVVTYLELASEKISKLRRQSGDLP